MIRHTLWLTIGLLAMTTSLSAQTAAAPNTDVPPPQPPLVSEVPVPAQWTITIKYGKDATEGGNANAKPAEAQPISPSQIQKIQVTKTETLKRDIYTYGSGTTAELWYAEKLALGLDSGGKDVAITPLGVNSERYGERGNPYQSTGFTGVGWLKIGYYDKAVRFQKEICYHYVLKAANQVVEADPALGIQGAAAEAWISVKTNLPVAYRFDGVLYVYEFDPARPASLTLPPNYQAQLDRYHRMLGQ